MADGVIALLLCLRRAAVLEEFTVGLERGDDIELWRAFARARADGAAVDHEAGAVEAAD